MKLSSVHIDADAVSVTDLVSRKQELFELLAEYASNAYGVDKQKVTSGLAEREQVGSTGFGGSVAIPHTRIEGIDRCVAVVLKLVEPLAFDAYDSQPVDLVFALLSPKNGGAEHLKALAEVSRYLRDDNIVARLRGAANNDALFGMLTDNRQQQAA
ncbi:hypothetical protein MNBD_ALPHA04-1809 [hydrothermal vent metagenome]|uniref:PTS EIIA type-2 domain-containing protein n=1 Tax=hydrothermal vent metagenome TaxID=652676 RepID=A0A3B0SI80_9ZZZZ